MTFKCMHTHEHTKNIFKNSQKNRNDVQPNHPHTSVCAGQGVPRFAKHTSRDIAYDFKSSEANKIGHNSHPSFLIVPLPTLLPPAGARRI